MNDSNFVEVEGIVLENYPSGVCRVCIRVGGEWRKVLRHNGYGSVRSEGDNLVTSWLDGIPQDFDFHMHDAALIAAAPVLVDALESIVAHIDMMGGDIAKMSTTRKIAQNALNHIS